MVDEAFYPNALEAEVCDMNYIRCEKVPFQTIVFA